MPDNKVFDVIIVGGSYAGLAAGMALGRALRNVLIIDSGKPCNRQTPYSHNLITQDGRPPGDIAALAKQQVGKYESISFFDGLATSGIKTEDGFEVQLASGEQFRARRLIFATGIKDILPGADGFADCWGISVIHCPYCHGYEVRDEKTGILGNGEQGFEFARLISNWTKELTLFTNGYSTLTGAQTEKLEERGIKVVEKEIERLEHVNGYIQTIIFSDGTSFFLKALYAPRPFEQHCRIPETLGCELTDEGYIGVDAFYKTRINGIFACGDNVSRMRTLANAIAMGTATGMMVNKEIIFGDF